MFSDEIKKKTKTSFPILEHKMRGKVSLCVFVHFFLLTLQADILKQGVNEVFHDQGSWI